MTLVRFSGVGRQYGARWVVRDVSFHVSAGERWGIVGRNGEGKTTLLRMMTGEDTPTEGEIWRHPGIRFTLLRQNRGEASDVTVGTAALEPFSELLAMELRLAQESAAIATVDAGSEGGARLLKSYDHHLEQFRRRGGYEMRARAEATLEGLGFPRNSWEQPIRSLSGGELGRLRLVQTLLEQPDVLLLDEPTNHLDLRATEWLEGFLQGYAGTVLVVSHDRVFLERLAGRILHLEDGTAFAYPCGYDEFLVQREERRLLQQKEFARQQDYIARTEDFIRRNIAGQKTKQAKSRRKLLAHLDRVDGVSSEERAMALRFDPARRSGGTVVKLDGVACGFGERRLFAPFSAEVGRGEAIAIVGPNGSGKSTLMRALAGEAQPERGDLLLGVGVRVSYYRQDFTHLDASSTIREQVGTVAPRLRMQELRSHLARFLFTGDEIEARVGDLSGGEQARVALAMATLQGANVLLLDEPTNHLDIPSREALEESLQEFDGTVIVISHDRAFLSAIATRVWALPTESGGRVLDFAGSFDEWLESQVAAAAPAAAIPAGRATPAATEGRASSDALSKNEIRRREREMETLESRIAEMEAALAETDAKLADPALYAEDAGPDGIRSLTEKREREAAGLGELYAQWERLGEGLRVTV